MRFRYVHCLLPIFVIWQSGCSGDSSVLMHGAASDREFGGKLVVEPAHQKLGTLLGGIGKTTQVETRLSNLGNRRLRIFDVVVSCECTGTSIVKHDLEPGESTIMKTDLKLGDTPGPRMSTVMIRSSDESRNPQNLVFDWITDNPLRADSPSFSFSDLPVGQVHTVDIPIRSAHLAICKDCLFESAQFPGFVKTSWSSNSGIMTSDHSLGSDRTEAVEVGKLRLQLMPQSDDRHYEHSINIVLKCNQDVRARLTIPVRWSYDRPMAVAPSKISLGIRKPGEIVQKDLFLKGAKGRMFRILSLSSSSDNFIFEQQYPSDPALDSFIKFAVKTPSTPGPWRETITIRTDLVDGGEIQVPVSGIIEE